MGRVAVYLEHVAPMPNTLVRRERAREAWLAATSSSRLNYAARRAPFGCAAHLRVVPGPAELRFRIGVHHPLASEVNLPRCCCMRAWDCSAASGTERIAQRWPSRECSVARYKNPSRASRHSDGGCAFECLQQNGIAYLSDTGDRVLPGGGFHTPLTPDLLSSNRQSVSYATTGRGDYDVGVRCARTP